MGEGNKISKNALVVVLGLVISVAWIIIGLVETPEAPGLSTVLPPLIIVFVIIVSLVGLILIPICARENKWGFLSALILGIIVISYEAKNQINFITGTMPEGSLFVLLVIGGVIWLIIQIPIIIFSYRAYHKS